MPAEKPDDASTAGAPPEIEIEIEPASGAGASAESASPSDELPPIPADDELPPPEDDSTITDAPVLAPPEADVIEIPVPESPASTRPAPAPSPVAVPKLTLVGESGARLSMNVTTALGKHNGKVLSDEARFMDTKQLTLEKTATGWQVIPNTAAPNETLLNNQAINEPRPLQAGDVLAVGRESKGVVKMKMTVQLG